jgi:ribosomal protein S18 acetylase RimI-like enzyme
MKGIGKHLVENVMAAIKQAGGTHLEFQVNRRNKAVGFYQRIGFHILREEDFDIGHGFYMNDYIMGCQIQ